MGLCSIKKVCYRQYYSQKAILMYSCVNNNMGILLQPKSQYRSTCRKGNQDLTTSFQMPFLPTYSQLNNGSDLVEDRNVTSSNQSDCSPPVLIPSTLTVQNVFLFIIWDPQDGDIDGFVPLTPQASLLQCSRSASQEFAGFSLPSAVVPTVVKSLEEVAVFKTPHRIGEALVKHAYYSRKIPQTIDVLVRNSVKNFEMTTTLSTKLPLNSLHSQSKFSNENVSF
ncbi:hypothetical protein DICVIV_06957 [Dictyocaulus viviparus]|uniref:Uncharacterized protein n=1 Tax=Dictyocaulus viviparus TaxID=29172 RepID=A0A0D8XX98_DICVI|nr:hypothetical protein DICVIV_06957 [Dictyocaulus viviparus]